MRKRGREIKQVRVREVAESKGLTLDDVAYHSGEKYPTVRSIWYGKVRNPLSQTLFNIARAVGVQPEELVEYEDIPNPDVRITNQTEKISA